MKKIYKFQQIKGIKRIFNLKNRTLLIEGGYLLYTINFKCKNMYLNSRTLTFERNIKLPFKFWLVLKAPTSVLDILFISIRFQKKFLIFGSNMTQRNIIENIFNLSDVKVKSIFSEMLTVKTLIKNFLYHSNFVTKTSLKITGYFRRVWFISKKKLLCLKIGRSFLNKIKVPNKLSLSVVRRRLIKICSSSKRLLIKFSKSIYNLQPADPYRMEGIQSDIFLQPRKERFISKKR